jgi:hypothetical protein
MRNGASDQEIAELMQELREATDDYMRQLAEQAAAGPSRAAGPDQRTDADDAGRSAAMMDRIQELMEQGRMAEAQQALEELQQMMENMQVTQGQGQKGQQSPGQQAMEGLPRRCATSRACPTRPSATCRSSSTQTRDPAPVGRDRPPGIRAGIPAAVVGTLLIRRL